jgi:hypothetical protein
MRTRNSIGQFTDDSTASVQERFERQFSAVPEAGCWIWTGASKNQFGHGAFKLGARKTRVLFAHRVAWELYVGPIPAGRCVLHRCDTPSCVNPHHLFLGTKRDNAEDMVRKGRQCKGSAHVAAKIDERVAALIKRARDTSTAALAAMFGISRQSVADIRYGRTWKHV